MEGGGGTRTKGRKKATVSSQFKVTLFLCMFNLLELKEDFELDIETRQREERVLMILLTVLDLCVVFFNCKRILHSTSTLNGSML